MQMALAPLHFYNFGCEFPYQVLCTVAVLHGIFCFWRLCAFLQVCSIPWPPIHCKSFWNFYLEKEVSGTCVQCLCWLLNWLRLLHNVDYSLCIRTSSGAWGFCSNTIDHGLRPNLKRVRPNMPCLYGSQNWNGYIIYSIVCDPIQ